MPKLTNMLHAGTAFNAKFVQHAKAVKLFNHVNQVKEAPTKDTAYTINGKKYGRPHFRLKSRGGDGFPESDAFWFVKDSDTGKVTLFCIIEVFRDNASVRPFFIKDPAVTLNYPVGGEKRSLKLKITQSPYIQQTNILQDLHAQAEVKESDIQPLKEALSDLSRAPQLTITADLWWQVPGKKQPPPRRKPPVAKPVIHKRTFNPKTLVLKGRQIAKNRGGLMWNCKDVSEAKWCLHIIKKYAFDTEISIGAQRQFRYFLSKGKIPVGPKFQGEDVLAFDKKKVSVLRKNNRYIIGYGNRSMFSFGNDKASANEALRIIRQYGADGVGYMKRPRPAMIYLKATKSAPAFMTALLLKPMMMATVATVATPRRTAATLATATVQPTKPQKIRLSHAIGLHFQADDSAVFGDLIEIHEAKDFKWRNESIIKGDMYTIYYRPTARPDTFYFLPQVFRIKVNEYTGEPKISIAMVPGDDPNLIEKYRIIINLQIVPYYNPKAKKDLYRTLDSISVGKIKYCNLRLGGFNAASFDLRPEFGGENAVFRGKVSEKIEGIDPTNGFTLSVECTLESFDFFKREIINGFTVGDIIFDLIEETEDGETVSSSQPIPVELDIRKLGGIKVGVHVLTHQNDEEVVLPKGVQLFNESNFPISIGGTELMLLSDISGTVYEADYEIGNNQPSWPLTLPPNKKEIKEVLLKNEDIDSLSSEDRFWTRLICEPHGIRLTDDPNQIMAKVIDYASGDPQIWELLIECPIFERWDDFDESFKEPYKLLNKLEVEVKNESEQTWGILLDHTNWSATIQMARSISDILKTQQINDRKYSYRLRSHYILEKTPWTDWLDPESTAANYLGVNPPTLSN